MIFHFIIEEPEKLFDNKFLTVALFYLIICPSIYGTTPHM